VLQDLAVPDRQAFAGALVPSDPGQVADLWAHGFDLAPAVALWLARRGRRRVAPPELTVRMVAEIGPGVMLDAVLNLQAQPELTGRTEQRLDGRPGAGGAGRRAHR
jgi:hypothetical protein